MSIRPDTPQHPSCPLLTFVIPSYNTEEELLRQCIESVLSLPLQDDEREIIVVDDGSDTPVATHLQDFGKELRCLRQEHAGLSAARNTGLEHARGTYVQFLDSDDYLRLESYSHCLETLREQIPDVLLFRHTHRETAPKPWRVSPAMSGSAYLCSHNLRAAAWGYLFRRELLGELRFRPGILHEDEEFTPQLFLRANRLVEVTLPAYFYRVRSESIVHSPSQRMVVRRLADFRAVIVRLKAMSDTLSGQEQEGLKRRVNQLTMDFLYNTVRTTRSLRSLYRQVAWLRRRGLFPLPIKQYSRKYALFSVLTRILL